MNKDLPIKMPLAWHVLLGTDIKTYIPTQEEIDWLKKRLEQLRAQVPLHWSRVEDNQELRELENYFKKHDSQ